MLRCTMVFPSGTMVFPLRYYGFSPPVLWCFPSGTMVFPLRYYGLSPPVLCGPMGSWAPWAHGPMGPWAHGPMGPWTWIDPGSIQDRSRIDPGSIQDRSRIDPGSIQDESKIDQDRSRIDLGYVCLFVLCVFPRPIQKMRRKK